ncbi:hypothetical protein [Roseisalinus antarcticus]|uniref:Uncharacterized protein n=1 Tax=Roseisalinus antarcticus TaxID=254357 RepID=A0A1Y5TQA6_9RHOB|nr:hypothetical protein [Roseisalinus antarcticus]SLN68991.1 hypothetical protein ROA7023_03346 [Roseisalinus antarcticus]
MLLGSDAWLALQFALTPAEAAAALGPFGRLRPLAYLSRQDRFLDRFYREALCRIHPRVGHGIQGFFARSARDWVDFEARLAPWIAAGGLRLRSRDDAEAGPGVLADLCTEVLGLEGPPPAPAAPVPRLPRGLVTLARAVNRRPDLTHAARAEILQHLRTAPDWAGTETEQRLERKATLLARPFRARLAAEYAALNRRLAAEAMTGPTVRFVFPDPLPPRPQALQRHDEAAAAALALRFWPPAPLARPPVPPARTPGSGWSACSAARPNRPAPFCAIT